MAIGSPLDFRLKPADHFSGAATITAIGARMEKRCKLIQANRAYRISHA